MQFLCDQKLLITFFRKKYLNQSCLLNISANWSTKYAKEKGYAYKSKSKLITIVPKTLTTGTFLNYVKFKNFFKM